MSLRNLVVALIFLGTHGQYLRGQTSTAINPIPATGILPGSSQVVSNDDDISLNSGNLLYKLPLYRFPNGPGGVPMEIGLVYNSFTWQTEPRATTCQDGQNPPCTYDAYFQSQTGGGWNYSFNYQLATEYSEYGSPSCLLYRLSIIFPDGSRHVLHPKLNGTGGGMTPEYSPDGF